MAVSEAAGRTKSAERVIFPLTAAAGWRGARLATQVRVLTARSVRVLVTDRRMLLVSLIEPLLMLVIFSQVFGGLARTPGFPAGTRYIDFLVPAIMVTTAMQSGLQAGTGLIDDMRNGVVARFRSLPIWLGSVLVARSLASGVRTLQRLLTMTVLASVMFGFDPAGGVTGVLGAGTMALVVGSSLGWIFIAIACWMRRADLVQAVAGMAMFPLMFASSVFVPVAGLPGWLQAVARVNPMTYGVETARNLAAGQPIGADAVPAIVTSLAIAAVAAPIAVRGFRRSA